MKFLIVLLSATAAALATQVTPTVSSYSTSGCSGTPLATWSGVANLAVCQATPGAVSLDITVGTETNCEIDVFATSTCDGINGNFTIISVVNGCYTSPAGFSSVRILCILTG
ncbi:hypothetical protein DFH08DRAFT_977829 [Mycena albidolilacea]|uniref:Uncharacterized protein n=1 Tax=Mycena albidolilacea TaxID=1033008 RepID=A0AAD7E8P2_9AGAR|nr:hypothetical protein DFH08DRAFT_977829 [Mycena albidolilacea]